MKNGSIFRKDQVKEQLPTAQDKKIPTPLAWQIAENSTL